MEPDDLYGLPLERFTAQRNALAKELRKEGRRDDAAKVSKLSKPSIAAWAVNQLVRTQRREVADLFAAGDSLRDAQEKLLAGRGEAGALRDAVEVQRGAVDELTEKARGLLSAEGHELTPTTLAKVAGTLNAAALDRDVRPEVEGGCLVQERHHVGLGSLEPAATGKSARSRRRGPGSKQSSNRGGRAPSGAASSSRAAQARPAQSREARKTESDARHRAERSVRELETAQSRRDRAAQALRAAEEGLHAAEQTLARAVRAADAAAQRLEELRRRRERG